MVRLLVAGYPLTPKRISPRLKSITIPLKRKQRLTRHTPHRSRFRAKPAGVRAFRTLEFRVVDGRDILLARAARKACLHIARRGSDTGTLSGAIGGAMATAKSHRLRIDYCEAIYATEMGFYH